MPARPTLPRDETAAPLRARDVAYGLGLFGFIYASRQISSGMTQRPPAVLLISANSVPFELTLKSSGQTIHATAAVVAPRVERSLEARGVALLSFNIMPSHKAFYVFGSLQRAGALPLDRHAFAPLDDAYTAISHGTATFAQAEKVFNDTITEALRQTPPTAPPDKLALEVIRLLEANPQLSPEELARRCGRSQQMMSRQFSSAVGMPLRDYLQWLKQRHLFDLLHSKISLTDVAHSVGFSDSSGLSRTFLRWYGQSPSVSRNAKPVFAPTPPAAGEPSAD